MYQFATMCTCTIALSFGGFLPNVFYFLSKTFVARHILYRRGPAILFMYGVNILDFKFNFRPPSI